MLGPAPGSKPRLFHICSENHFICSEYHFSVQNIIHIRSFTLLASQEALYVTNDKIAEHVCGAKVKILAFVQ